MKAHSQANVEPGRPHPPGHQQKDAIKSPVLSLLLLLGARLIPAPVRAWIVLACIYLTDAVARAICLPPRTRARLYIHAAVLGVLFWSLLYLFQLDRIVSSPLLIGLLGLAIFLDLAAMTVVAASLVYMVVKPPPALSFDVGCNDPTLAALERVGRLALERADECDPEACANAGNNSDDQDFFIEELI